MADSFRLIGKDYFNSIKVRLEPASPPVCDPLSSFQFHKGTIRTQGHHKQAGDESKFQFHKGTIRTSLLAGDLCGGSAISIP